MKFSLVPKLLFLPFCLPVFAIPTSTVSISYDTAYDDPNFDLLRTACSDGFHGLVTQGYRTAGQLASWPRIGGSVTIEGWNSLSCGKCYKLGYNGTEIWVLAVDHAAQGMNIAKQAMDLLYKEGLFKEKTTIADPHVSINPERTAEIMSIIGGHVTNPRLLRFIEEE